MATIAPEATGPATTGQKGTAPATGITGPEETGPASGITAPATDSTAPLQCRVKSSGNPDSLITFFPHVIPVNDRSHILLLGKLSCQIGSLQYLLKRLFPVIDKAAVSYTHLTLPTNSLV